MPEVRQRSEPTRRDKGQQRLLEHRRQGAKVIEYRLRKLLRKRGYATERNVSVLLVGLIPWSCFAQMTDHATIYSTRYPRLPSRALSDERKN